jgi:hypothetical protein
MADKPVNQPNENDELLTTVSLKIPRWTEDVWLGVCHDTDLNFSQAGRIVFIEVAKHIQKHWRKGPALGAFLEHLEFRAQQYNLFFERKR